MPAQRLRTQAAASRSGEAFPFASERGRSHGPPERPRRGGGSFFTRPVATLRTHTLRISLRHGLVNRTRAASVRCRCGRAPSRGRRSTTRVGCTARSRSRAAEASRLPGRGRRRGQGRSGSAPPSAACRYRALRCRRGSFGPAGSTVRSALRPRGPSGTHTRASQAWPSPRPRGARRLVDGEVEMRRGVSDLVSADQLPAVAPLPGPRFPCGKPASPHRTSGGCTRTCRARQLATTSGVSRK
jgi:hypothetical protein